MDGSIKVHLYQVRESHNTVPLETLLQQIRADALDERLRTVGVRDIRAEEVKRREDGLWLLDFAMLRFENGPARAHRHKPMRGFEFEDGEGFGEETAALYDPERKCLIVQYNHFGVRSGAIQRYLSEYDRRHANAYELAVVFDHDVERKLATKNYFSKISIAMATTKLNARDVNDRIPLSRAVDIAGDYGARNVAITVSMGPGRHDGLDSKGIKRTLNWIRDTLGRDDGSVSRAEVICKENPDGISEVLDLVQQRLTMRLEDIGMDTDLRLRQEDRWKGLMRAHRGWADVIRNLK